MRHIFPTNQSSLQVRGTPGSGKTTLLNLLAAFILKKDPSSFVKIQHSWPPKGSSPVSSLEQLLQLVDPAFPRHDGLAYLLFDEGQDSYSDERLWNFFLKEVDGGIYAKHYRIVLFCSYGSPSSRPVSYSIGTPLVLRDAARISLWPKEGSIGILLTRFEFDEVVSQFRENFGRPLNLHPELQDLIFDWTVGHAGAVIAILQIITYQVSLP